jgi:hypothetical protein
MTVLVIIHRRYDNSGVTIYNLDPITNTHLNSMLILQGCLFYYSAPLIRPVKPTTRRAPA